MQYKVNACLHSRMYLLILSNSMSDVRKRNVAKRVDMIFPFMALLLFQSDSVTQGSFAANFGRVALILCNTAASQLDIIDWNGVFSF